MAVDYICLMIAAFSKDSSPVSDETFLNKLKSTHNFNFKIRSSTSPWQSALITLAEIQIKDFKDSEEPYEDFEKALQTSFTSAANWLSVISDSVFRQMRDDGLSIDVFIDAWIDQDQLAICIPAIFLKECGNKCLDIRIITND